MPPPQWNKREEGGSQLAQARSLSLSTSSITSSHGHNILHPLRPKAMDPADLELEPLESWAKIIFLPLSYFSQVFARAKKNWLQALCRRWDHIRVLPNLADSCNCTQVYLGPGPCLLTKISCYSSSFHLSSLSQAPGTLWKQCHPPTPQRDT
jgi:hypothetical protein